MGDFGLFMVFVDNKKNNIASQVCVDSYLIYSIVFHIIVHNRYYGRKLWETLRVNVELQV